MSDPKHTPLSGPCPSCEGRGYDYESGDWSIDQPIKVACPDCAGTGKAENSITANEKLRDPAAELVEALAEPLRYFLEWREEIENDLGIWASKSQTRKAFDQAEAALARVKGAS